MSDFVAVCRIGDIGPGTAKRYVVDGVAMAIVRTDEGVFAINDRCSHADVSLAEGEVDGCAIECWLHGSVFDLRTGVLLSLPAIEPVLIYGVQVVGDGDDAVIEVDSTLICATIAAPDH